MTLSKQTRNLTTQKDIMECLATIKSLHPNWNDSTPELTLKLWHYQLKGYPVNDVKKAVLELASSSKYIPKLAEVIEALNTSTPTHQHVELPSDDWDRLIGYEMTLTEEEIAQHRINASRIIEGENIGNDMDKLRAMKIKELRGDFK